MFFIDQKLSLLLVVCSSPLVILLLHILFSRLTIIIKSKRTPQFICIIAVLFGNLPFFALLWTVSFNLYASGEFSQAIRFFPSFSYALIAYNLIGYTYFHIFNMSETARRVFILYGIYSLGSLTKSDIEKIYPIGNMVAIRVERLLGLGQIRKESGAYLLDGRLLYYAAVLIAFWSRLIGLSILPEGHRKNR